MRNLLLFCVVVLLISGHAFSSETLRMVLKEQSAKLLKQSPAKEGDGKTAYLHFVDAVARELQKIGDKETSARLTRAMVDPNVKDFPKSEFAWVTHAFAREYYKESIIKETAALMKFQTFASTMPNRQNPEFIKQKEYLQTLAGKLGLNFKDVDGYVQEIWIGDGKQSFGIMSHSDVQPVDPKEWSHDPWSGDIINGKIWGRGSVDDKGPIVAVMYGMRAILDSRLSLKKKIILLVGTDEESANEDVTYYLKTNKAPDETIVVDSNYPVVCAEKGWCGVWLEIPKDAGAGEGHGMLVASIHSGFSPSIVPERATARILNVGGPMSGGKNFLDDKAAAFMKRRKNSRLTVEVASDTLVVTAFGKSVHSASPEKGHNALMDLMVFLDKDVVVLPNANGLMAKFASTYIGFELNGKSLGIAHKDDFMGEVSVSTNMFHQTDSTVMMMFNFRIPKGLPIPKAEQALNERFESFGSKHGFRFHDKRYMSEPLYNDPNSAFVQKLLLIYNTITGDSRPAESIGGGTYAKRIPNAVVFGPALPHEEYRGHRPDEYLEVSTLVKNVEILTHTMVEFGM